MSDSIAVPTQAELLAAVLPVEEHRVGIQPDGSRHPVVLRFMSEDDRAAFLREEARILGLSR